MTEYRAYSVRCLKDILLGSSEYFIDKCRKNIKLLAIIKDLHPVKIGFDKRRNPRRHCYFSTCTQ